MMLPSLIYLGIRSLLVAAASDPTEDEEDGLVEDEPGKPPMGFPGGKMPTAQELLGMLDSMDLPDEEKESLRDSIMKQMRGGLPVGGDMDDDGSSHVATSMFFSQFVVLMSMLALITLIFVFFGYKLYKSLSERERKREEKKKNKQLKKKSK